MSTCTRLSPFPMTPKMSSPTTVLRMPPKPPNVQRAGEARQQAGDGKDDGNDRAGVDARQLGGLAVAACHVDVTAEPRAREHEVADNQHGGGDQNDDRHAVADHSLEGVAAPQ